jgi:hypothetical protein
MEDRTLELLGDRAATVHANLLRYCSEITDNGEIPEELLSEYYFIRGLYPGTSHGVLVLLTAYVHCWDELIVLLATACPKIQEFRKVESLRETSILVTPEGTIEEEDQEGV